MKRIKIIFSNPLVYPCQSILCQQTQFAKPLKRAFASKWIGTAVHCHWDGVDRPATRRWPWDFRPAVSALSPQPDCLLEWGGATRPFGHGRVAAKENGPLMSSRTFRISVEEVRAKSHSATSAFSMNLIWKQTLFCSAKRRG